MGSIFNPDNLFFRIMTKIFYGAALSLLWLLFSIPIVTMGAATSALDDVMLRLVRDEEGYLVRSFVQAFGRHFKKATLVWIVWLAAFVVLCGDFVFFMRMGGFAWVICAILTMGIFLLMLVLMILFHDLVWFENSWKNVLSHSFKMALGYLPYSFAMLVLSAAMLYGIYVSVPLMFIFGFFGMGIFSYISAYLWRGVFDWLENKQRGMS
mgnify:CR=1 FL=1